MDEPPFALVCGWRYPLLIIAKGGSFSTASTLRLHSSTSLACGFSCEQKQDVRHPDAPCQDPQTIAICTTGCSPSERSVFLCWLYRGKGKCLWTFSFCSNAHSTIRRQLNVIVPDTTFLYESRKFYLLRHHSRHCD